MCTASSFVCGGLQWRNYLGLNSPLQSSLRLRFEFNCALRTCLQSLEIHFGITVVVAIPNTTAFVTATDCICKRNYNYFVAADVVVNTSKVFVLI